jgi:hypothetical protein
VPLIPSAGREGNQISRISGIDLEIIGWCEANKRRKLTISAVIANQTGELMSGMKKIGLRICPAIALILCCLAGSAQAHAQRDRSQNESDARPLTVITGHPYSAHRIIFTTKRLPGGTTATQIDKSLLWRDAQGRTREEQILKTSGGSDEVHVINVSDPVARRHLSWSTGGNIEREVFTTPISEEITFVDHIPGTDLSPAERAAAIERNRNPNIISAQRLGPATINGLEATGLRTVMLAASEATKDHELRRTHETWRSSDSLALIVRSITNDPATGKIDIELTDIDRHNPDPSLFQPPPDYRLQVVQR